MMCIASFVVVFVIDTTGVNNAILMSSIILTIIIACYVMVVKQSKKC